MLNYEPFLLKLQSLRAGVPQFLYFGGIGPDGVIAARQAIRNYKQFKPDVNEVDVIIHSPGGIADDAYRLIKNFHSHFETINVIVPFWAKSAATLFSIGATRIVMDEFGEFGPLDAQLVKPKDDNPGYDPESALNDESAVELIERRYQYLYESMHTQIYQNEDIVIEKTELSRQLLENLSKFYTPMLSQINPYKLGEKKRILDIGRQYALRILTQFGKLRDRQLVQRFVDFLINGCPDHGFVIDKLLLEKFLKNVYSSDIFGEEYKDTLSEFSLYIMDNYTEIYSSPRIGFIEAVTADQMDNNLVSEILDKDIVTDINPT